MPGQGFIVRRNVPIHDTDNLCVYGQRLLEANDPRSYQSYDTLEKATATGGHPCKECAKIREARRQESMLL